MFFLVESKLCSRKHKRSHASMTQHPKAKACSHRLLGVFCILFPQPWTKTVCLRCTTGCLDINIHCELITIIKLISIPITSQA